MPSDESLDQTMAETRTTLEMFEKLQRRMEEIQRNNEAFAREFGIPYENVVNWVKQQDTQTTGQKLSPAEQQTLAESQTAFQEELKRELEQAELRFREQKNQPKSSSPRSSRGWRMV